MRHFVRVRTHVTLVQPAQPHFRDRARENQNQSNDGKWRHEGIVVLLWSLAREKFSIVTVPITLKTFSGIVLPF